MPRRKRVQQERQKVLCITAKKSVLRNHSFGQTSFTVTNAISERSCSTLRRIKTYLRSTMTQSRLNHRMMLNSYKKALGELSLVKVANAFCRKNETRLNIFWKFSQGADSSVSCREDVSGNKDFLTHFIVFYFWFFLWQSTTIKLYELFEGLFTYLQYWNNHLCQGRSQEI